MTGRPDPVPDGPDHYAYVTMTGDGALSELTALVGLAPDEGWDRNDIRKRGRVGTTYGFTRWSLYSGLPRGAPVDDHLTRVFERLAPVEERFVALGPEWRKYISVTGSFDDPSTLIGISVLNHGRAATLGLTYDFDFYFDGM